MRFVTPDVERIDLKDGPDGSKNWIEVKLELTAGETRRFRTAGLTRMRQGGGENAAAIDVDWVEMAVARVEAYLTDWSAKDEKGKKIPVNSASVRALCEEDFKEIDDAIQAHIVKQEESKNAKSDSKS